MDIGKDSSTDEVHVVFRSKIPVLEQTCTVLTCVSVNTSTVMCVVGFGLNDVGAEMDRLDIEYPSSINDGRLTSGAKTQGDSQHEILLINQPIFT